MHKRYQSNAGFGTASLVIVLIVGVLVSLTGYTVYNRVQADNKAKAAAKTTNTDPYAGWQTYSNSGYKFSVKYPAGWQAIASDPRTQAPPTVPANVHLTDPGVVWTVIFNSSTNISKPGRTVYVLYIARTTVDAWVQAGKSNLSQPDGSGQIITYNYQISTTTVANRPATQEVITYATTGKLEATEVYVPHGDLVYSLEAESYNSDGTLSNPIAQKILNSLQITQ